MDGPIPYVKKVNNDPDIVKAMKIVPATSLFKKYNIIILNIKEVKPIIKVPLIWGIIFFFMLFFKFLKLKLCFMFVEIVSKIINEKILKVIKTKK